MSRESIITTIVLLSALLPIHFALAASNGAVVINEIAWMGTTVSANDEWVELYNPTGQTVNLDSWVLKTADNKLNIKLSGNIGPGSFYLLERTDDESAPSMVADLIYNGALANDGERLQLYDATGVLVDEVNPALNEVNGWLAGNNTTKQTMERVGAGWQDSQNPGGTPKAPNTASEKVIENSSQGLSNGENGVNGEKREKEGEKEGDELYSDGIVINEILPSPDGADEIEEWIELKNINGQEVDISGWRIKDTTGTIKTYKFPAGTKINGYSFLVLSRPVSKISLNNTGDGLILLWPDNQIVDETAFGKALLGQSWNRAKAGWAWSAVLTPNKENIISQPVLAQGKPFDAAQGKQTKKTPVDASFQETAAVGLPVEELFLSATNTPNQGIFSFGWPAPVFLFALGLAVLSAIAVLLLKKFLARNVDIT